MLELVYGNRVLTLPHSALAAGVNATANDWRVLCAFAASPELCRDEKSIVSVARELSIAEG